MYKTKQKRVDSNCQRYFHGIQYRDTRQGRNQKTRTNWFILIPWKTRISLVSKGGDGEWLVCMLLFVTINCRPERIIKILCGV